MEHILVSIVGLSKVHISYPSPIYHQTASEIRSIPLTESNTCLITKTLCKVLCLDLLIVERDTIVSTSTSGDKPVVTRV